MNRIIHFFYQMKIWHRGATPTIKEQAIKTFYCIYLLSLTVSAAIGAMTNENVDQSVFLAEITIVAAVLSMKLSCLTWKQNQVQNLLKVCAFPVKNDELFVVIDQKLGRFMKFVFVLFCSGVLASCFACGVLPLLGSDRAVVFKMGYPLKWKNNTIAFWMANAVLFISLIIAMIAYLFSTIIWYMMLNYSIRYTLLGDELGHVRRTVVEGKGKMSEKEKQNTFLLDLKASVDAHQHLTGYKVT